MSADELEAALALEEWEAAQQGDSNVFSVIETGDARLIGAYILRGFRQAARRAAGEQMRVMELREFAYLAFETGDDAEAFLRSPKPRLQGQTPLQAAVESGSRRDEAILSLAPKLRGAAIRVFGRLAREWDLSETEQAELLDAEPRAVAYWHEHPDHMPASAVERISVLLGIFRAINTLIPKPAAADGWIRRANSAPLFQDRSALGVMLEGGVASMREVRSYLDAEIWGR